MARLHAGIALVLAVGLLDVPGSACADETVSVVVETNFATERPEALLEPALPPPECESAKASDKPDPVVSRQRNRHALNWILGGRGAKRFDVIEWSLRPDLLTLADLTSWSAEHDYAFGSFLNFDIRWWAGPQGNAHTPVPNLPPRVYDLNLFFTWRQRWADGVTSEVTILPGLYTDFRTTPPDAFRSPGHAVGVFRLQPDLHLVAGVQYLQRVRVKVLPIAGLLWEPDDRWQWRLVFPEPKISYHLDSRSDVWLYVRGEYGGGTWAYKDDFGRADLVEYSDIRVAVGVEWGSLSKSFWPNTPLGTDYFEIGYVFQRSLAFSSPIPATAVPAGWMIGLGWTW